MESKQEGTPVQLSDEELKMYVKLVLSTLKHTMSDCETYDEFKKYINSILRERSENDK